ncbi:GCFC-domain-containing protein [Pleurotus eryngii]|uniref:GCFC-domain-containing protein n=1 Tax=Pleurotus eryngii TaxID=5323 RepID=A0A9P6A0P1_PLEER|nr:GCFC-domain-containing protein [Pleurotus eryngii]
MTEPVIFKRTKSKPKQRARQTSPASVDEEAEKGTESPSTLVAKLKKRVKPKSRLSFGAADEGKEGDGEVFQVKKSSLSQKLILGRNSAPSSTLAQTSSLSRGPVYDSAYLSELKASTPSTRPRLADDDGDASMDVDETSISNVQTVDIFESETTIPAEATIKNAKEKRERLRGAGVGDDFISLSVTRSVEDQGPHPESRLVREEDELGEGDDEFAEYTSAQERIALGKKSRKVEASKRRDAMKEMIADAEEEDDETMEWEQEQLRRGGNQAQEASSPPVKRVYVATTSKWTSRRMFPTVTPIPSLGPALSRLAASLSQLTVSHASNTSSLNAIAKERSEVDEREIELRDMVDKAELKRSWFDGFHEWVEGVAGFLDEKYPQLEKLEEAQLALLKQRLDVVVNRRRMDDEDDLTTFRGRQPNSNVAETITKDEFGRSVPPSVLRRERRAARLARRARRQSTTEEEGYSTDSSLAPAEQESYELTSTELIERKADVLADVRAAEFKDPAKSKWWREWREKYTDSYVGAWGGLGLVGAWEFWVRLEIVGWDMIEDPKSLDSCKWYKGLYEYSRPGDPTNPDGELGPDGDLVSSMISTAVIPRVCKLIEGGALDVYSGKHIHRIVDLAEEMEVSVERGSAKFQALLKSVYTVFDRATLQTEELIARSKDSVPRQPVFDPEAIPARSRFLARRIKLVQNLMQWRKFTGEMYGAGEMANRLVDGCIRSVAEEGWDVGGEVAMQKAVSFLPSTLVSSSTKRMLNMP